LVLKKWHLGSSKTLQNQHPNLIIPEQNTFDVCFSFVPAKNPGFFIAPLAK